MRSNTFSVLISLLCLCSVCTTSCKKFLATYSQNNNFIETANDLDELLVGDVYYPANMSGPDFLYLMDDDTEMGIPEHPIAINFKRSSFHHWKPDPRIDSEGGLQNTDYYFSFLYKRIAHINTILLNVPLLRDKGESADNLKRISGEAHFLRAYYYFVLVNTYGKPYRSATANDDFGVPVKTDPAVKDQFVARSSNKQVYDQIIADLLEAEKELQGVNSGSTIRANQAAVQCLLSKVYLFTENYEKALHYADQVINSNDYQLTDLNNHIAGNDFLKRNSKEVVFTMGFTGTYALMSIEMNIPSDEFYTVSNDLLTSFSPEDLRPQVFFIQSARGDNKVAKKREHFGARIDDASDLFLLRLSEQYLNKAEALVAMDRFEDARTTLQEFRKKRFKPADLGTVTATDAALMTYIRDERRREFCFEAHRWFDLRRYAVNAKYPFSKTIRHRSIAFSGSEFTVNGYYELLPYEQDQAAYIVPVANDEIEFNQGLLTNEPRPARPLKH